MKQKLKVILLDFIYFLLFAIILILIKIKLGKILINLKSYGAGLNTFTNQNVQEVQNLLSQLNSIAINAFIFLFIIIPLISFILYVLFQGLTFKKEKFSFKRFILISLFPFIALILTLFTLNVYSLILFIITGYIVFISYFYDLKKINLAYKKFYKLFPMYLLYLFLPFLIIGFFYLAYTRIPISFDFIYIILFGIFFSILFSLYKIYLIKKLN